MNEKELNKLMITNKEVVRRLNKATEKILKLEKKIKITPTKVILSKEAELNIQQKAQQDTARKIMKDLKPLIKFLDRLDKNDYFSEDEKKFHWKKHLKNLKSNWGDKDE